jgi:hypothetical protein
LARTPSNKGYEGLILGFEPQIRLFNFRLAEEIRFILQLIQIRSESTLTNDLRMENGQKKAEN